MSTSRRTAGAARPAATTLAVAALLAAVAFVAVAFVARPAPVSSAAGATSSHSDQTALGLAASGHPDFVGVAEPRPSIGLSHLLASPTTRGALAVVLLVTAATAVRAGAAAPTRARWIRWRARLEGAPPLVA